MALQTAAHDHLVARMQSESSYIKSLAEIGCLEDMNNFKGLAYPCNNALQVPAHSPEDDLGRELAPLERVLPPPCQPSALLIWSAASTRSQPAGKPCNRTATGCGR